MNKLEIYQQIVTIMQELFELDPETIQPESQLHQDLDIDSIDAVELMLKLKTLTGKKVTPEHFHSVATVENLVDTIALILNENSNNDTTAASVKTNLFDDNEIT